jgi:CheY-like chemotaxis protein
LSAEQRELLFDTPAADDGQATHGDALVGLDLVRQALGRLGAQVEWMHPDPADNVLLVRLPLADQAGPSAPAAMTLLCIEDNPVNLMLVQELVAMRPGIVLHSAVDGSSGLAAAAALRPDVVLLDLHLPDMDGRQVAAQLRADPRTAGCRLVALSANAMPEDIREARAQGFDDYWTKPIDFDRFLGGLDAIASALATARAAP